jgi:hypothetical protein
VGAGITRLLVDNEDADIGRALWSRLSAVMHVTWWGLQWAISLPDAQPSSPGFSTVPVGTDAKSVLLQAVCILRALRVAANARFTLMGWQDSEWQTAERTALEVERAMFRASGGVAG